MTTEEILNKHSQVLVQMSKEIQRLEHRVQQLEAKDNNTDELGLFYTGSVTQSEPKTAKYKRITSSLVELQAMYDKEDTEWERNFIQGILDFTGQTVTDKQYKVLKDLSQRVNYTKELVTQR